MKYVILIHSNPEPWGHPTSDYTAAGRALPAERKAELDRQFEALLSEIHESGELVSAEALGDPASSTLFGRGVDPSVPTEGPYAETKEHLAGFFLIDCSTRERAEAIAVRFAGDGDVIELRPVMSAGADDR
jgi:hypothetical protein